MNENQQLVIKLNQGTILSVISWGVILFLIYYLRDLVLVVLTSIVIASAVQPAARRLEKWHLPFVLAVLTVYLSTVLVFLFAIYFLLPPLFSDLLTVVSTVPEQLIVFVKSNPAWEIFTNLSDTLLAKLSLVDWLQHNSFSPSPNPVQLLSQIMGGLINLVLIIVISFYLAVQKNGVEDFLRLVLPQSHENYVIGLWRRVEIKIGRWAQGQLLLGLIVGPLVYLGLTILGVKYALLLAMLAAVFELIPYFGPTLSAVPAVLLGFSAGIPVGLMVIGLYVIIQQFENHLIYPLVVQKIIGVPPLLAILSLLIGWRLAGLLGFILAVPVATILMELANDIGAKKGIFRANTSSH